MDKTDIEKNKEVNEFFASIGMPPIDLASYKRLAWIVTKPSAFIVESDFTRINNDINGNPRYVIHFTKCLPKDSVDRSYENALCLMRKLGGKKFHNKQYGGGIAFQVNNIKKVVEDINKVVS